MLRSSVNQAKYDLADAIIAITEQADGQVACSGDYPAWEYQPNTLLEQTAIAVYKSLYSKPPILQTIHAGLECGILAAKAPQLQCISIGPDILEIHTPRERLSIPSAKRTWEFLCALLERLATVKA